MRSLALWLAVFLSRWQRSGAQSCINDIAVLSKQEAAVTDTSVQRTYILCPRTIYTVGTLDLNYNLVGFNVMPSIPVRPNLTVRCGDSGSIDNLCWIIDGDVHVDATNYLGVTAPSVDNVLIEGFVFIGTLKHSFWATKPGNITFRNCEWRVRF